MSKITVFYQPAQDVKFVYLVEKKSDIANLLQDISSSCTGKVLIGNVMELGAISNHICFLESLREQGYSIQKRDDLKGRPYEVIHTEKGGDPRVLDRQLKGERTRENNLEMIARHIPESDELLGILLKPIESKRKDCGDEDNLAYRREDKVLLTK